MITNIRSLIFALVLITLAFVVGYSTAYSQVTEQDELQTDIAVVVQMQRDIKQLENAITELQIRVLALEE